MASSNTHAGGISTCLKRRQRIPYLTDKLHTQADQVLSELHGLFKAFGKIPEGSTGKKTLDPTGLRLALANLDPKRFAAGDWTCFHMPQCLLTATEEPERCFSAVSDILHMPNISLRM